MPIDNCGSNCTLLRSTDINTASINQVTDFFYGLFDTKDWPPRWKCGNWSDFHGWLYITSDIVTWAAYFAIPALIMYMLRKRKDLPFSGIFVLFFTFILLCGSTHLLDAIIFWWPAYRFSALLRFCTACVSVATVYFSFKALPHILTLRSITELETEIKKRKLAEEQLKEKEFLYSEAARISEVGTWQTDLAEHKRTFSPKVYDIFELPYNSLIDEINFVGYFTNSYKVRLEQAITLAVECGIKWDFEATILTHKNRVAWVRTVGEPIYNDEGKVTKLRGVILNIDKYKNVELALSSTLAEVHEKKDQLRNFTHILSHNIRNYSSNINVISHLFEPEKLDEDNADLVDKLKQVCRGLNNTLNDLSEAIKIKESNIKAEEISFKEEATKVLHVLHSEIKQCTAKIEMDFTTEQVVFPKIYLESILLNLLSNAVKYRNPARRLVIKLSTYTDENNKTVLECRDNGLGINLKKHGSKIFGLYKTFHENANAHGVGLFMTKIQTESQGGRIAVDSTLGEGSTFKIIFNEKN